VEKIQVTVCTIYNFLL